MRVGPILPSLHISAKASKTRYVCLPSVVIDLYWGTRDPDMATSDSIGQDPTIMPGDITSYSHQVFLTSLWSPALPPFCLFLFHFSVTYFLLLVVPEVSECLGSS